jgi:two-component system sensor histidine kinase KdpD
LAELWNQDRKFTGVRDWRASGTAVLLFILECALGVLAVAAVSALTHWFPWLGPVRLALCLLAAAASALLCGFWQAVVVSCSAVALLAYWTTGQIAVTPSELPALLVALLAFLLATLTVSRLSAQVQMRAEQAEARGRRMEDLYEFTRRMLQMNLHIEPGEQLAEMAHEIFALEAVAVFDSDLQKTYTAGYWEADPRDAVQNVYYFGTVDDDPETGLGKRVIRFGSVPIGSIVVRGQTSAVTNNLIASLIAIAFDRYRAFANESTLEAARRTEQLRATVLDSLAHAYKTPLTAIRAASTGLSEMGKLSAGQADLVALIDEQAGLLAELTTKLLTTARLDSEDLAVNAAPTDVAALVDEVVDGLRERLASMKLTIDLQQENMTLNCDRRLLVMLLTQYVDNACKYSSYGAPVTIKVENKRTEMVFSVHSFGSVIPMADRERIFDRYYRSSTHSGSASGTGIGLSVAKRAALVHGGHVWVTSEEQEGTTFFAAIPTTLENKEKK